MVMALGELDFVERFIDTNTGPFYVDNLLLIGLFMIIMPIALMNLLIGVAVGDIDAIKNDSTFRRIMLRVSDNYSCTRLINHCCQYYNIKIKIKQNFYFYFNFVIFAAMM